MNTVRIAVKTAAGLAELNTRQRRLSQRHRTLLHLADGRRSEAQWRSMGDQAGIPDSCFDELLALGMVELHAAVAPARGDVAPARGDVAPARSDVASARSDVTPAHSDVAARVQARPGAPELARRAGAAPDSELPALRTLPPASAFLDSATGMPVATGPWFQTDPDERHAADEALASAREVLLRALRHEAPVAGLLTSLRVRRARTHEELERLIDEIEARADDPRRSPATSLALHQARSLLGSPSRISR